jgi:tetratricopeptide (TPR) repeat protein
MSSRLEEARKSMHRYILAITALLVVGLVGCASKEKTGMKIYVQQKLYDKAIDQGQKELAKNPDDGDTHYFLGAAYFGKDQELSTEDAAYGDSAQVFLEKAFYHFTRSQALAESSWGLSADENIRSMYGHHFNRGVIATKNGDHVTAAMEYKLATIADPAEYDGFYHRAGALWQLAEEARKAGEEEDFDEITSLIVTSLDQVLTLEPDDKAVIVAAYQTKGDVLYERGDLSEAQDAYRRAVQLDPENYNMMTTMAERFYNEQDWDNAAAYFQDALSVKERLNLIDSDDAAIYSALGNTLSKLERRQEAIAAYTKVLDLTPTDQATMYNLMVTHYKAGEDAEKNGDMATAKQHYNQAIGIGDQLIGIDAKRPEYWQVRGLCKRGVGDFAGAARDLKEFQDLRASAGGL